MEPSNPTRVELGRARSPLRVSPERVTVAHADGGPRASGIAPEVRCGHNGLAMIHGVVGGYVARCLACQAIGPIWDTAEAARRALLDLETPDRA